MYYSINKLLNKKYYHFKKKLNGINKKNNIKKTTTLEKSGSQILTSHHQHTEVHF